MATTIPTIKLNTGAHMPQVGLGTWQSEPGEVGQAVTAAIEAGYTHIDGAMCYQNEKEVGAALKKLFKDGKIKRENLFYTSKLWNTFHRVDKVAEGFNTTLSDLGLDYLDLFLVHWPYSFQPGETLFPKDANDKIILDSTDIVETWKEMEKLVDAGKVKAIGVSNFDINALKHLLANCRIRPAVNQVELHPYLPQPALVNFCKKEGIAVTAYSPLGSGGEPSLIKDETITKIANAHGKDAGQILISWAVQRGTIVIPKSVKPSRIQSNLQIIKLSDEEMKEISSIKTRKRFVDCKSFWSLDLFKGDTADN
ncbi:hypothetical protein PhCBS80983_g03153 [Powellomyces hirtus]|uniref:NADP-dependent oxidoreductase domain-containing protein n=1 Tax=Powellomyces hirtus TaxID=109895 RepID=A0A507E5U4_9FUNG|nr:hypothetical protein PhCBS80983_g03153 [Powellomyces hirtus]